MLSARQMKDPRVVVRLILAVLLIANIIAALLLFKPWGGSAEDLARQMDSLKAQLAANQLRLNQTKDIVEKVQKARAAGDRFMSAYMVSRRSAFSTLISETNKMAIDAGMKPRESSWALEPVEGSDTVGQLTISANYEGSYASLFKFVNELDKSPRFLIIETLSATPQQSGALAVNVKLDTFIRDQTAGGTS
jgi:type IV pilus assembly protein PilO